MLEAAVLHIASLASVYTRWVNCNHFIEMMTLDSSWCVMY